MLHLLVSIVRGQMQCHVIVLDTTYTTYTFYERENNRNEQKNKSNKKHRRCGASRKERCGRQHNRPEQGNC